VRIADQRRSGVLSHCWWMVSHVALPANSHDEIAIPVPDHIHRDLAG
jgi:hypothetical protein